MHTFTITAEKRRRAQARAAELDICLTDTPGQDQSVCDNKQNRVTPEYGSESTENETISAGLTGSSIFPTMIRSDSPARSITRMLLFVRTSSGPALG
jgi:hypothetical protein